jgi:hypothetical protein
VKVTGAQFENLPAGTPGGWKQRLSVGGTGFVARAAPAIATVGNVAVQSVVLAPGGKGFVGFLAAIPPIGAELKVGYLDTGLQSTGITYQPAIV